MVEEEKNPTDGFKQNWRTYVGARDIGSMEVDPLIKRIRRLFLPFLLGLFLLLLLLDMLGYSL